MDIVDELKKKVRVQKEESMRRLLFSKELII
ncbi:hypothetical protein BCO_0900058 (plasmid) [Borrelia coriaceae ATCC 43381]|uniref:Uncharacterized protein n=1 Tax=Borrelia coriaceae ATCC 43381 TaxID=1408429 RepID=W5SWG3_9SPIR|nr:hypothetical protein BCO_0900058 [Borrelia coriaceae ATCC 43381]